MTNSDVVRNAPLVPETCKSLTIRDLQTILLVSQAGSIRRASASMGVGQPAVTRRIQRLEDALGVSIFERSQTGVRLTTAGWALSAQARRLVGDFGLAVEAARAAGEGQSGHLQLGLIASLSQGTLRDTISKFIDLHPCVDLTFLEADRGELMTLLSHRALDVVFASGGMDLAGGDALLLTHEQIYLAVARDHPLAGKTLTRWTDIEDATFVVSANEPGPEISDYVRRRVSDLGRQVVIRRHGLDREGIMNLVGLGVGMSLVCNHWRGISYPNVAFVPLVWDGVGESIPFSLVWRPENDNPALRRFLSLARNEAKRNGVLS
ncbi:LysR family transcriptional regulator [Parvularcula bermudensis]|uniref:LysR family transcriptional regulator n=1 Tax=Parvularcula bermudensis TaxID=208216 RepID=UPI003B75C4B6